MFKDASNNLAPISILITTIAADLYRNEDTISETLTSILDRAKKYVEERKENGGGIYIPNLPIENFADKWAKHPERADAFLNWLDDEEGFDG